VRRRSRSAVLILAAVMATAVGSAVPVLGIASPVQAHNYPVSSTPKAGETLTALPAQFVITTNDLLLDLGQNGAGFGLQVTDASGRYYGDGCVKVDGPSMSTAAALGAAGKYTVTWQVVSTDGHTVSDSFEFTWRPPAGFAPTVGGTKVPDCNGTASVNTSPSTGSGSSGTAVVDGGTLSTVLWIGGAFLAVATAVILTLLFTARTKKPGAP
jgi:methionine-rich copper-binding protein CopC